MVRTKSPTLSFSEAVQSVTETDLTVTGAEGYTVSHEAGSDTASVTVTVADGSIQNVSVAVNSSILDIAGNPLIQAVDEHPDCRYGQSGSQHHYGRSGRHCR